MADLDRLHDRLYALEAALEDVEADALEAETAPARRRAALYAGALAHLRSAAEDLRGTLVEPVTA